MRALKPFLVWGFLLPDDGLYPRWERSTMPRETIYGKDGFDVSVFWGRADETVQVASTFNDSPARTVRMVREWLLQMPQDSDTEQKVRDAAALLDELGGRLAEIGGFFDGWHTTLADRRGVNDLIRLLQRARDGAFGKDA